MTDSDAPAANPALSPDDVAAVRAAASALARQEGNGIPRRSVLALAGRAFNLSVLRPEAAGDPVVAIVHGRAGEARGLFSTLTPREQEVAALLAHGHANKQVAATLGISVATVKDHVHRILAKTGLPTRGAVAAHWQRR